MHRSGKPDGSSTVYRYLTVHPTAMARDATQSYLNEIGRYPLLTKAQEVLLGTQVQAWMAIIDKDEATYTEEEKRIARMGARAKEKFIKCNLRLVVNVARKYTSRCTTLDLMDLVQEGNVGLVRAVEKFDPTRGYAMSTYAYWWIRQAIQRSLQFSDATIRLPINVQDGSYKITKAVEHLTKELNREPTTSELSEYTGMSINEIRHVLSAPRVSTSLDRKCREDEGHSTILEMVEDKIQSNTVEDANRTINIENAYDAIDQYLDETTRFVVLERLKDPPSTWKELTEMTGITRGRLQNIEQAGLRRCAMLLSVKKQIEN